MRVLIATSHFDIVGGVETYLRILLPQLSKRGFELGVLAERGEIADGILAGCPHIPIWVGMGRPIVEVLRELAEWRPDVVYSQGFDDPRLEAAIAERFPTVFFAHNYHGTCISGTKCHSRTGFESCQRTLGPGCLALYLPRGCGGRNPLTMLRLYSTQRGRKRNLELYRAVIVASRHMFEEYLRHGVPSDRLQQIPLFPPGIIRDPSPPAERPSSGRVLFVGRITRLKGLQHLIAALPLASAELVRPLTLVVAGDGPERAAAEAKARLAGVPTEFLGWVDVDRRTEEMRKADILAVPSVWPEPFGLVGIEAGCVGLPAVGYAVGGIPDWLVPGVSGESAPGDRPEPKELAKALVRALSDDIHLRKLRIGAWENCGRFTADIHLRQLVHLLESTASSVPSVRAI